MKKILIVDDSPVVRGELRAICEELNDVEIVEADNGKDGIDQYFKQHPDLVFLDVIMPDVNGIDVLKQIGKDANIVMISALGEYMLSEEAKKLGAIDFVEKPFSEEMVIKKIQKIIG